MICLTFSSFFRFSLFGRTLGDTHSTRWNIWFPYIHGFRKRRFFMNILFEQYQIFGSSSDQHFVKVHYFFGIDFRTDLFIDFSWKMVPMWMAAGAGDTRFFPPFSRPFLLCRFISKFVTIWHPFGSVMAPFSSLLPAFGSLLTPVGSLLVPLALLLLTLGRDFLPFGISWR